MTARIVEIMLCILLLSSCASKRKVTTTDVIQSDSVRATAKTDIRIDAVVDTMTTTTGETTVVEIDFFEPVDTTGHPVITIGNDGITINSGNVKSEDKNDKNGTVVNRTSSRIIECNQFVGFGRNTQRINRHTRRTGERTNNTVQKSSHATSCCLGGGDYHRNDNRFFILA